MLWWTLRQLKNSDGGTRVRAAKKLGKARNPKAVETLIAALNDSNEEVQCATAEALGEIGDVRAVEPLIVAALESSRNFKPRALGPRLKAAWALGEISDARAVEPLVGLLKHPEGHVESRDQALRRAAAGSLGKIGDAGVEALLDVLEDENELVRRAAGEVLDALDHKPVDEKQRALMLIALEKWNDVANLGSTAIGPLIAAASLPYGGSLRSTAREELVKIGDDAIEPLIVALKDSNEYIRRTAGGVLGALNWEPVDEKHQAMMFIALKKWEDVANLGFAAVEMLIVALEDSSEEVRKGAALALGKIGDARAVEPLIAALIKDSDVPKGEYVVRSRAAEALGQIGDARAVEPLIDSLLKDCEYSVRSNAARALRALADIGFSAVEPLLVDLKDSDASMRSNAAMGLREIGDARAVEPLIAALKDSDAHVRCEAAKALEEVGDIRAVEPLIAALKDSDPYVRQRAAKALEEVGDMRDVEPLIVLLKDLRDSFAQSEAARALGRIGDVQAVAPLVAALKDSDSTVRCRAAEALGEIGDTSALDPVRELLRTENNRWVKENTAKLLTKLGDTSATAAITNQVSIMIRVPNTSRGSSLARLFEYIKTSHAMSSFGYVELPDPAFARSDAGASTGS